MKTLWQQFWNRMDEDLGFALAMTGAVTVLLMGLSFLLPLIIVACTRP